MRFLGRILVAIAIAFVPVVGVALAASPFDRASIEASLSETEKDPQTKDTTKEAVKQARFALERATRMRASGDEKHAKMAEGVAHDWAEVARELERATITEKKAAEARLAAQDAGATRDRARAMLEQRMAENGRLVTELSLIDAGSVKIATKDGGR